MHSNKYLSASGLCSIYNRSFLAALVAVGHYIGGKDIRWNSSGIFSATYFRILPTRRILILVVERLGIMHEPRQELPYGIVELNSWSGRHRTADYNQRPLPGQHGFWALLTWPNTPPIHSDYPTKTARRCGPLNSHSASCSGKYFITSFIMHHFAFRRPFMKFSL